MDPFSVTVGALGITSFAVSSITQLHDLITSISEAKGVVQEIGTNLENIRLPLAALGTLEIANDAAAKEVLRKTGMVEAVNECGKACEQFGKKLKKWTKHSTGDHLSLADRLNVGVWNKEKIRTFKTQVETCQATVHFAVSSTQLIVQLRSDAVSKADRDSLRQQIQMLEARTQEHLELTKRQQDAAQRHGQELQQQSGDDEDDDDEDDDDGAQRVLAVKEVEEQSCLLEAAQVSLGVIYSQAHSARTGQQIGDVVTSEDSRAFVGLPESVVGKIDQRIGNVSTTKGSAAMVGMSSGDVDMSGFWKTGR